MELQTTKSNFCFAVHRGKVEGLSELEPETNPDEPITAKSTREMIDKVRAEVMASIIFEKAVYQKLGIKKSGVC